ncbi:hypothetical protein NOU13_25835 [Rhodococcus erythropolis]|uniref:hypothetical protein n=1 Tax=Rhodococcus erythropolis TaxID=1833 RepID=UPI00210A3DF1|nr:hypothetical protein [Rhodococcus erythropolis]MCQ4127927.1 hypothetical protein [Rhodococcus erythropolis]
MTADFELTDRGRQKITFAIAKAMEEMAPERKTRLGPKPTFDTLHVLDASGEEWYFATANEQPIAKLPAAFVEDDHQFDVEKETIVLDETDEPR